MEKVSTSNFFSATESFLGQIYQLWYALWILIQEGRKDPAAAVSVEVVDDIGIQSGDQVRIVGQVKYTTANLTDSSGPLWKTLRIWSELASSCTIDLDRTKFLLITSSEAPEKSVASMLRPKDRNVSDALDILIEIAQTSTNSELRAAFRAFLGLEEKVRAKLVGAITVLDRSPDLAELKKNIESELCLLAPPGKETPFAEHLGMRWRNQIEACLESGTCITFVGLRHLISDTLDHFKGDNLPIEFLDDVPGVLPQLDRRFVRQLGLVEVTENRIRDARIDYCRAFAQRSSWLRRELVGLQELPKFDKKLSDECNKRHALMCTKLAGADPRARLLEGAAFYEWAEFVAIDIPRLRIRDRCDEPYVMRGTFHMLADQTKGGIGWHPDYETLLSQSR